MKSSNKIIFFNILSTVILQGLALFTAPFFSRTLGPENFGVVSIYTTWCTIVTTVLSLKTADTMQIARVTFPEEKQKQYQSSILSLGLSCFLAGGLLVLLFLDKISSLLMLDRFMVIVIIVHSVGQYCVELLNSKFIFEFKAGKNCILSVFTAVTSVVISAVLISVMPPENNYWGRVLGLASTYFIIAVFTCIFLFSQGKTLYNKEFWKFAIPIGLPMIFHNLSNLVLGQSDRIMLQHLTTEADVGIYSLAATFALALSVIWGALNNSWSPFYMEYTSQDRIDELKKRGRHYVELFTVLACGFVLLANEVYHVFADREFWGGTNVVLLLAVGYYFVFLYSLAVNYEFFHKKTNIIAGISLCTAVVHILLNLFFIRSFGSQGAAMANVIVRVLQFALHYLSARYVIKGSKFPYTIRFLLPYMAVFVAVAGFSIAFPGLWYIRWPMGVVLGVAELLRIVKRKRIF